MNPDTVNWTDKDSVIGYAKSLGKGHTVYKRSDRRNYNVCHTVNENTRQLEANNVGQTMFVVYRT